MHLTNIIYSDLKKNSLSDSVKLVSSRTFSKDDGEKTETKNAMRCNNRDNLLHPLKISIFSGDYI